MPSAHLARRAILLVVYQPMHSFPEQGEMGQRFQEAELNYLIHSEAGSRTMAENYVGLPLHFGEK